LDEYEPEALTAEVGKVLDGPARVAGAFGGKIQQSRRRPDTSILHRSFRRNAQERFGCEAAKAIGFDFSRGQLDVTPTRSVAP